LTTRQESINSLANKAAKGGINLKRIMLCHAMPAHIFILFNENLFLKTQVILSPI